jgi:hypothetical protein
MDKSQPDVRATAEAADALYCEAALKLFGEFANSGKKPAASVINEQAASVA